MSTNAPSDSAPAAPSAPAPSAPTGTTPATTGDSDRSRNRYRNRRQFRAGTSSSTDNLRNFKGAIETLPVLGTKIEKTSQDFSKFTKAIHIYVLANFTYPKDISVAVLDFQDPMRAIAADFPTTKKLMDENYLTRMDEAVGSDQDKLEAKTHNDALDEDLVYVRKAAFTEFTKRKTAASSNMAALWGVVMGQTSGSLQQQVKAEEDYGGHLYDPVWLLQTLKKVISGVTGQSNIYHSTFHALKDLYTLRQKSDETVEEYFRRFEASADLVHLSNETQVFDNKGLYSLELNDDPNITKIDVEQRFLAMMFVENACTVRYAALWKELSNSTAMKTDKYPKSMTEATYLLTHWKAPATSNYRATGGGGGGRATQSQLSFLQRDSAPLVCPEIDANKNDDGTVKGTDDRTHSHITCPSSSQCVVGLPTYSRQPWHARGSPHAGGTRRCRS